MTRTEKMLQAMREELSARNPESDKDWIEDIFQLMFGDNCEEDILSYLS